MSSAHDKPMGVSKSHMRRHGAPGGFSVTGSRHGVTVQAEGHRFLRNYGRDSWQCERCGFEVFGIDFETAAGCDAKADK